MLLLPGRDLNPTTASGCAAAVKEELGAGNDIDFRVLGFDKTTPELCYAGRVGWWGY